MQKTVYCSGLRGVTVFLRCRHLAGLGEDLTPAANISGRPGAVGVATVLSSRMGGPSYF
jgi:hypothetical protein